MRFLLRIVVVFACVWSFASAHPLAQTDPNQQAVDAYRKGDLASARTLWMQALGRGGAKASDDSSGAELGDGEKARVLYDLGNVAFRDKQVLEAVGWYTASLRLRPRDADTWANLEHARREAGLEPADRGDLSSTLSRVLGALTPSESEHLALGGVLVFALTLLAEAWFGNRAARRGAFAGALVMLALCAPYASHVLRAEHDPLLSIAPKEKPLSVLSEPRADAALIAEVPPGETLERLDELPDWTRVELGNGVQGWTRTSGVFALKR